MPTFVSSTPSKLAIFALEQSTGLPVARLPVYAEVVIRSEEAEPAVDPDDRLNDAILVALRKDAPENIAEPQPLRRLSDLINREIVRQLGRKGVDALVGGNPVPFVAAIIRAARDAQGGATLRTLDGDALKAALRAAVRAEAARRQLPLEPLPASTPVLWAYPLGVLASDHAGYLSYDLSRLPPPVRQALGTALRARRLDPTAALDVTIAVYPTGPGGTFLDALAQGRTTAGAIVSRIELARPHIPDAVQNLALPAMQNPSLDDWTLSPGSFATNPGSLIGADGCESILPANVALQEYHFYQVVRLTDVPPPVAPVIAGQVQLGVVNEYRIAWNPLGHSLGQILYSMPLAPGESVNLAVIDWTRRDEAQRKERTTVDEQLVHDEHRDRAISETVNTAVQEYQHGSSFMGGIAGAAGGTSGTASGGLAGSLGGSTSSSSGTRQVTGSTVQKLSDNVTQASSAMRELQSSVVVQSSQSEKEAIETRTVVNHNHSHALTILYYEVLRHFRVVTELVRQRPAVLVRFRTDWFDGAGAMQNILAHRAALAGALLDPRFAGGFDAIDRVSHGPFADLGKPLPAPVPPKADPNPPPLFHYFTFEIRTGGFFRDVNSNDQQVDVLASLFMADGSEIALMNSLGNAVINHNGTFREPDKDNMFTAVPRGTNAISWSSIIGIGLAVAVFPTDDDAAKVSFAHIKVSGIDIAGPPGVVLVDEAHEGGHVIIRNGDLEQGKRLTLPARRPAAPAAPAPAFSTEDAADRAQAVALIAHLAANRRFYSRAIALGQSVYERTEALDGVGFADGSTALQHLENRPLEVIGDYLAYPGTDAVWNALIAGKLADAAGADGEAADAVLDERLATLPTRGVFAEARLGHCNASEVIDNTRFWDWQQSPIPHFAPEIAPTVPVTPQPQQPNLSATPLPSPIVNIVNPPAAPDPTGLAAAFGVLATPNLFRDMSGRAEVADILKNLADNAVKIAGGGAGSGRGGSTATGRGTGTGIGGPRATATQPSAANRDLQDFQTVLGRAQADGMITPEAARQAFGDAVTATTGGAMLGFAIDDPDHANDGLVDPVPVHADELDQTLITYRFGKFAIFVPQKVLMAFRDRIGDVKVHLFFTAGKDALHDLLVHGVRGASNDSDWVTITVPGKLNGFVTISDAEIIECLRAAQIDGRPTALRLSGHSRGCDSIWHSVIGKTITTLGIIDRITFLDEAVEHFGKGHPNEGAVRMNRIADLAQFGIPTGTMVSYEVTNRSKNTKTGKTAHVGDAIYIDLPPNGMGSVGCARLVEEGVKLDATVDPALDDVPDIRALVAAMELPARGSFTSKGVAGKDDITKHCADRQSVIDAIVAGQKPAKPGVPSKNLLQFTIDHNLSGYGTAYAWVIACHHFFVAEIAHELVD